MNEQRLKREDESRLSNVASQDIKSMKSSIDKSRNSYAKLQSENSALANRMRELEEDFETVQFRRHQSQTKLDQEFNMLQDELNARQEAISSIHENNVSLQFEINTYRRLLEGNRSITFNECFVTREHRFRVYRWIIKNNCTPREAICCCHMRELASDLIDLSQSVTVFVYDINT